VTPPASKLPSNRPETDPLQPVERPAALHPLLFQIGVTDDAVKRASFNRPYAGRVTGV
jgi:hypothetical protein